MNFEIEIQGSKQVEETLGEVGPRAAQALVRGLVSSLATEVLKDAKKNMGFGPQSKGNIAKASRARQRKVRNNIAETDIVVGRGAFYWRFWEYGASNGIPEKAMFGRAVHRMASHLSQRVDALFIKKFEAMLKRNAKKAGKL